ncbi:hypothetical protein [Streptomyces sp. ISL-86]|uniref:hypothetical protein n=1 Tax=Streptomyces sp. ISL-86 TaxID=2819187 RepID=UPI001BE96885|nr:hypothetical protein [Streptomyces sp. ISL-86]MBT2456808.1 hypothetical protein [Streptomyces sp. ISL-86]
MTDQPQDRLGTVLAWLWALGMAAGFTTLGVAAVHADHTDKAAPAWSAPDAAVPS